ncbi:MAG: two-component system chemotaxis sensor kinase CheA [Cyclobacteriaceae bacterium]|jgi:two-component system chemotaxis sensor kinase CheA
MSDKESEYKELFLLEAKENIDKLENLFVKLEKNHSDIRAINEIFRITHTLKGNAMGMGFDSIGELSHLLEDVMLAIQHKSVELDEDLFQLIFRANDKLTALVLALETGKRVSYLGIKTSLSLFLNQSINTIENNEAQISGNESNAILTPNAESNEQSAIQGLQEDVDEESDISLSDVIQIPLKKMDELMSEMGQLVIERDRLIALSQTSQMTTRELEPLKRLTSNLQYSIMNVRMVKVGFLFNKFHRVVRDAAKTEGKNINLILKGTEVEIDRNILKVITDSLVHLVRNSVSHGIEQSEERIKADKPKIGSITLLAMYSRDRVIISIEDDGHGMDVERLREKVISKGFINRDAASKLKDSEVIQFIFHAGFSNADTVNEISGRGVGMDVVKKAVESVGGQVKVNTKSRFGTTISMELPVSLALKTTLMIALGDHEYAVGMSFAEAVVKVQKKDLSIFGHTLLSDFKGEAITTIFLADLFNVKSLDDLKERGALQKTFLSLEENQVFDMIIINYGDRKTGIVVDKVIQQKEMIEKPLEKPIDQVKLISGASIMGSGKVCPIVDLGFVVDLIYNKIRNQEEVI